MKTRLLTAVFGIPILLAVVIFSHTLVLPIAVAAVCAIGVFEMLGCIGTKKIGLITVISLAVAAAFPFLSYYSDEISKEKYFFAAIMFAVMFIYIFVLLCSAVFSHGKCDISDIALTAATTFYITFGFTAILNPLELILSISNRL